MPYFITHLFFLFALKPLPPLLVVPCARRRRAFQPTPRVRPI